MGELTRVSHKQKGGKMRRGEFISHAIVVVSEFADCDPIRIL
jgi:hypothetical protein